MNAKSIFLEAIEQPATRRGEYIAWLCAGNPRLTTRVRALVEAHDRADREQAKTGTCFSGTPAPDDDRHP